MTTVITYGTFDLFHKGHYNILKRAKEAGDYLIVGVTGETYDAERGKLSVQDSLATRIENVRKTGFADKIIVEEYLGQKIQDIIKYHVDVFVIGSDWKGKFDHIGKFCEIKYLERTKDISSTQLREEQLSIYKLGIASDNAYDNDAVIESKRVSGIHVESVFCADNEKAIEFRDKYELNQGLSDYEEFLKTIDIVYVKTDRDSRADYVRKAITAGKHVICDTPICMDPKIEKELVDLAAENGVVLMHNVTTLYLHAFGQLLWMAKGQLIGDLVSLKCSVSKNMFDEGSDPDLIDLAYNPICAVIKILGYDYDDYRIKVVHNDDGECTYSAIFFEYDNSTAIVEIGMDTQIDCGITLYGTEGEIRVPDEWWRVGYFKMRERGEANAKNYSSNFEGNGFRYLVQALSREIRVQNTDMNWITTEELQAVQKVLGSLE